MPLYVRLRTLTRAPISRCPCYVAASGPTTGRRLIGAPSLYIAGRPRLRVRLLATDQSGAGYGGTCSRRTNRTLYHIDAGVVSMAQARRTRSASSASWRSCLSLRAPPGAGAARVTCASTAL
eukprot:4148224-Pyramimonas_sp.AAC.2